MLWIIVVRDHIQSHLKLKHGSRFCIPSNVQIFGRIFFLCSAMFKCIWSSLITNLMDWKLDLKVLSLFSFGSIPSWRSTSRVLILLGKRKWKFLCCLSSEAICRWRHFMFFFLRTTLFKLCSLDFWLFDFFINHFIFMHVLIVSVV